MTPFSNFPFFSRFMLLTNEGEMMKNDNTKKEFTIRITTLIVTFFLCLFAGYSAFVSRGVAKMMAEEYTIRMRPSLIPSVEKVTYISTGEMLIELSIKNHGNTDVNLEETKIIEIDLPTYVDSLKIKIIEEEQLHLGSRYLPNTGKSYYFFRVYPGCKIYKFKTYVSANFSSSLN